MTGTRLANAGTGHHPASRGTASHQRSRLRWITLCRVMVPVVQERSPNDLPDQCGNGLEVHGVRREHLEVRRCRGVGDDTERSQYVNVPAGTTARRERAKVLGRSSRAASYRTTSTAEERSRITASRWSASTGPGPIVTRAIVQPKRSVSTGLSRTVTPGSSN